MQDPPLPPPPPSSFLRRLHPAMAGAAWRRTRRPSRSRLRRPIVVDEGGMGRQAGRLRPICGLGWIDGVGLVSRSIESWQARWIPRGG